MSEVFARLDELVVATTEDDDTIPEVSIEIEEECGEVHPATQDLDWLEQVRCTRKPHSEGKHAAREKGELWEWD